MSDAKKENVYLSIDLKSFYASVECRERGLDPMKTNLVVADCRKDREDDLSGRVAFFESIWDSRKTKTVSGGAEGSGGKQGTDAVCSGWGIYRFLLF